MWYEKWCFDGADFEKICVAMTVFVHSRRDFSCSMQLILFLSRFFAFVVFFFLQKIELNFRIALIRNSHDQFFCSLFHLFQRFFCFISFGLIDNFDHIERFLILAYHFQSCGCGLVSSRWWNNGCWKKKSFNYEIRFVWKLCKTKNRWQWVACKEWKNDRIIEWN